MDKSRKDVVWSPRVSKQKLRLLYERVSKGIWDEELIDDVGLTLYMRCRDIVKIHRARTEMTVTCPRCERVGEDTLIERPTGRETPMTCSTCGWSMSWMDYHRSFQRRQLNPGGAVEYFRAFVEGFERAPDPRRKMLAIDRVIHEFHYSFRLLPDQPTRAAGVNLIEGRLTDVIAFLDDLGRMGLPDEIRRVHESWRSRQDSIRWDEIIQRRNSARASEGGAC